MQLIRPGMGTENSAQLIHALIQMARPHTVIEIGAGDRTRLIAKALQKAKLSWQQDKKLLESSTWEERTALLDPSGIPENYEPQLITIDDFTAKGQSAEEVWQELLKDGIKKDTVTFINENFFSLDESTLKSWGPIDFAWIDAGTPADDVRFVITLWEHITAGGYLCLHEPTITTTIALNGAQRGQSVRTPLWEEILYRLDGSYEALTLPENHKYRQSGLGIIRKRTPTEQIVRAQSLQAELIEINELPIRNDLLPMGKETLRKRDTRNSLISAMTSPTLRAVYAAIILGAKNLSEVLKHVDSDAKNIHKSINRLLNLGLIHNTTEGFQAEETLWKMLENKHERNRENLSDRHLETEEMLSKIAQAFQKQKIYSETEVSKICNLFTIDFAR
ncbi:class I SAM-dependent methyltransferase [Bartonella sp. MR100HLJHH]|uniref:class I SAM-dependent methyltransferase n=1 Tax=Bartonella sp. MR100HLJHH TaxID=3243554 RepID=UPI0035D02E4A